MKFDDETSRIDLRPFDAPLSIENSVSHVPTDDVFSRRSDGEALQMYE
jgi:hypothetical protein